MSRTTPAESPPTSALYRAVWRWHFFAGILVAPLAAFLAITGAIYIWKPQYEAWRYRNLTTVSIPAGGQIKSLEEQYTAAMAGVAGAQPVTFTPSFIAGESSELVVRILPPGAPANLPVWAGERTSVYVNPYTAEKMGAIAEKDRAMHTVRVLHGELLAGAKGDFLVELAASWMFVLLLTGLYLWWPRPTFSAWGFLLPRLGAKSRVFWRDLHAVPAVWVSAGALFLLATGIPWAGYGGAWFSQVSATLGQGTPSNTESSAHRSELLGWSPPLRNGLAEQINQVASTPDAPTAHAGHGASAAQAPEPQLPEGFVPPPRITLDQVAAVAKQHGVPQPYAIAMPVGPTGVFSALSDYRRPFKLTYLHLDQYSGKVLAHVGYDDFGLMGKFFTWGIVAHEGVLFGILNQILGTLAALGILLMAVTGVIMWWRRRPAGQLGAPVSDRRLPRAMVIGTLVLTLGLPLLAASLVVLLVFDRLLSRHLPWFRPSSV